MEWFESEVDASEVPLRDDTCYVEEKINPEGYLDSRVCPLKDHIYFAHRWSHDGFVLAGYGFTYDADENSVSDVYASNSDGIQYDGTPSFRFISPEFDKTEYENEYTTATIGKFSEGIKFEKQVHRSGSGEFLESIFYVFWSEDWEVITEHQKKLSRIADDLRDLKEIRDEMLEGYC